MQEIYWLITIHQPLASVKHNINTAYYSTFPHMIKVLHKPTKDNKENKAKMHTRKTSKNTWHEKLQKVGFEFLFEQNISGRSLDGKRDFVPQCWPI